MKPYAFHPEANQDYVAAATYYFRIDAELGRRFYDEMERLIGEIRSQPDRFRLFEASTRRHFSDVFPYAIIYVDQNDRILIIAVMHFKRLPGYWKSRTEG